MELSVKRCGTLSIIVIETQAAVEGIPLVVDRVVFDMDTYVIRDLMNRIADWFFGMANRSTMLGVARHSPHISPEGCPSRARFVEQQRAGISKRFETRIGTFRTCPIAGCSGSRSVDQQSENRDSCMAAFDPVANLLTGRQAYFLDVAGTDSAAVLSVVSFEATEKMGAPTEVRIVLTHPSQLARADYLNLDARFSIVPDDGPPRKFSGFIARFSTIQTTKDHVKYEIVLKSHLARLEAVTRRKVFQHASTPDIIAAILRSHGLKEHQFSFRLRGQYRKHLFRMQHQMSDSAYIHMLAEKAGIYYFIVETEHGDQVVFGDDVDHYIYDEPQRIVPYREAAGLEAGGIEAVTAIKTHTVTVPQSFIVADYNPAQAWERFRDEANVAPQTKPPTARRISTARTTSTRRARSGRRSFGTKRPSPGRSCMRARATCWRCSARACLNGHHLARCAERPGDCRGHAQRRTRQALCE
jgi:type VI secretion system secreted protein VgrG